MIDCSCCECKGRACLTDHPGHSHRTKGINMNNIRKEYLGDGAYIQYDGWNFILTTENGIQTTNEIVLNPEVAKSLLDYINKINEMNRTRE